MRYLTAILVFGGLVACAPGQIDVTLTRGDQVRLLDVRPSLTLAPGNGTHSIKVVLDPTQQFQSIDGFGAAVTDSSAWIIQNTMSPAQRNALLDDLFLRDGGIGLNMIRIPMGASDFALAPYTYNDLIPGATDPNLVQFSTAYDWNHIIPTLQQIQTRATDFKLVASPWSPPAWMKTSGTLFGGSLLTQWQATYAEYFARFILDYEAAGLPIWAVTPQNEPQNDSAGLPSMWMPTFTQSAFVGDHLGPVLDQVAPNTKIIVYDHNWDAWNFPLIVFNDAEADVYADGAAFHGYAGDVSNQSLLHDFRPDKEIHFFEISGGDWATNFGDNLVWFTRNIIIGTTRNWSRSALYWNLALNQNDGPFIPGGCPNCRGVVTVNSGTGNVTYEVEYYGLAHASKFVQPGAVRIDSTTFPNQIETVAFRNPDCSEVLIALNPTNASTWFNIVRGGQSAAYRLTGESVATLVYQPIQGSVDMDGNGTETGVEGSDLSTCMGGPDAGITNTPCLGLLCSDPDGDGDLDMGDFALVQTYDLD